ncbi:hypothetical protein [Flavobacterium sp. MK4S-17]|uniref:hypothetical protein n=1 Tax=Flavobacterium sp. MK4S-17 TaxID=2543737 RepID=UPI001357EC6B|nr:hypothetical protein [Flavobacterium sp. MK4S-17]
MKSGVHNFLTKSAIIIILFSFNLGLAQDSDFWSRVRFGGSFGLAFGNGYTDVTIAPGALYEINDYVGVGLGLQGTYVNQRRYYSSFIYGASAITVFNPIPQVQLSAEVEQLRVNLDVDDGFSDYTRDFWNTALFLGAGYRMENVTIGLRYNVLFKENDFVYSDALMPFIRVYF